MFFLLLTFIIIQRVTELIIAKKNEKRLLKRGGVEHGSEHYPYIVALHVCFLLSLFVEVTLFQKELLFLWFILLPLLLLTQFIRYWSVFSLGPYWNTKIIIVPDEFVPPKGPYKFIKHPNYVVVALELVLIPLLYGAYMTATIFTCLNIIIMMVRIPAEEKALQQHTNYLDEFKMKSRFLPRG